MISRFGQILFQALSLLLLTTSVLGQTLNRTPARILAKQTGAAQFEEHIEQPIHRECNEHHHRLRKRSSDEDLDYEVYQGVVGRPGIDFPIFPRIPQTTFSCRTYGNGYFADLETTCQVFHICEEGRKISFLCPNGTIFQQSELTCDWWFKVNCAGSPGFYAESSEILSKSRRNRDKAKSFHKAFKNSNKFAEIIPDIKHYKGSERRIDSNENPSVESFDFEDLSDDKSNKSDDISIDRSIDTTNDRSNYKSNNVPGNRKIVKSNDRPTEKSSSRSNGRTKSRTSNRSNDKLITRKDDHDLPKTSQQDDSHNQSYDHELQITAESSSFVKNPRVNSYVSPDKTLNKESEFVSEKTLEKAKDAQISKVNSPPRGSQKHTFNAIEPPKRITENEKPSYFYITSRPDLSSVSVTGKESIDTTVNPEHYTNKNSLDEPPVNEKQHETIGSEDRLNSDNPSTFKPDFFVNRPLVNRFTTPSQYSGTYSTARRLDTTRTTPFYTPTVPSIIKTRPTESKNLNEPIAPRETITSSNAPPKLSTTTERENISDTHRFSLFSNKDLNVQLPIISEPLKTPSTNSLGSSTSGPTYLPKTTKAEHNHLATSANINNVVSRNVEGILQTVGVLKETMKNGLSDKNSSPRAGLDIPPSSGPGTLISLTNYFASDDQVVSTTNSDVDEEKTTTPAPTFNVSAGLLSNKTSEKYLNLFGLSEGNSEDDEFLKSASTVAPQVVSSPTVVGDFTRSTIRELAQDPETRKIAQVFSNAISKYIENPDTFRKDLIDVRPQPPTNKDDIGRQVTTLKNNLSNVVGTSKPLSSATEKYETTTSPTTESNDIAKEINSQFDVSTPVYSSILPEAIETTTYPSNTFYSTSIPHGNIGYGIASGLLPPSLDEETEHESLQKVQSQSFVKSYNDLTKAKQSNTLAVGKNSFDNSAEKQQTAKIATTENTWSNSAGTRTDKPADKILTTTAKIPKENNVITETPWPHSFDTSTVKSQSSWNNEHVNKLETFAGTVTTDNTPTVKDKLNTKSWIPSTITTVKNNIEAGLGTTSGNSWLQNQQSTIKPTENPWSQITQSIYLDPLTINDGLMREPKTTTLKPLSNEDIDRSRFEDASKGEEGIEDILNSPELSSELLPKNNGLQRIANKLFGGLNETEAVHLQNVMKKAEHNQNVLRLLLLLIQTCDDQNGKALERSRKVLLNALIGMDDKLKIKINSQQLATTTNKIPVTTYHRVFNDNTKITTTTSSSTTELSNSSEETTRFEIRVPDPDDEDGTTVSSFSTFKPTSQDRQKNSYNNPNRTSDQRALELLKSLYSLASKFSRR